MILLGNTDNPANLWVLVRNIDSALGILASWQITPNKTSRLPVARRLLEATAINAMYPSSDQDLLQLGNAIRLGFDFHNITNCLGDVPISAIAEDVRRALRGTLRDFRATDALRAQSQLEFASVMLASGLFPKSPSTDGAPTPDYVIRLGSLDYGVEIKRPESSRAVRSRLGEAVSQLEHFGSSAHFIVMDVSDCIELPCIRIAPQEAHSSINAQFSKLRESASSLIHSQINVGKFQRVAGLVVYASKFAWTAVEPPTPNAIHPLFVEVYPTARAGLIVDQTRDVRRRLVGGYQALSVDIPDAPSP